VAEGAHDQDGNKITPTEIKTLLADKEGLALDTRITTLGHVQRGGTACAYDRYLATLQGVEAVNAVLDATPETPTPFIAITENKITRKPLVQAVLDTKEVARAIESRDFDKAMSLRDTEFTDVYNSYMTTTATGLDDKMRLPPKKVRWLAGNFQNSTNTISTCELPLYTLVRQLVV
jgi:6-phosphofructokinase 1